MNRRSAVASIFTGAGMSAVFAPADALAQQKGNNAPITPKEKLRITKLETLLVKPRWLFLKIHTNAGITGLGEPITEGRALTCAQAVKEVEPYLIGKDPRPVAHHWQAIYRHGFYRGGPVLTAVLSGIDMALWDIKGKALGLPVHELLGGPTRQKIRVYGTRQDCLDKRCTAMKTLLSADERAPYKYVEGPGYVDRVAKSFAKLREELGPDVDIGVEFHGAVQPQ